MLHLIVERADAKETMNGVVYTLHQLPVAYYLSFVVAQIISQGFTATLSPQEL